MNKPAEFSPSPGEFAQQLAERYGPRPDPGNPFFKPAAVAVRRLLLQAISEVFGPQDPMAQFATAYERAEVLGFPVGWSEAKADALEACLDDMRTAWEVIEQDTIMTIEAIRG